MLPSRLTLQMIPHRWQQVKAILADALEYEQLEPRSGFVQRACAGINRDTGDRRGIKYAETSGVLREKRPARQHRLYRDQKYERVPEGAVIESHLLNLGSKLVFCSAQSLLEATQKLVLLAVGKRQIVVSQLTVFLL